MKLLEAVISPFSINDNGRVFVNDYPTYLSNQGEFTELRTNSKRRVSQRWRRMLQSTLASNSILSQSSVVIFVDGLANVPVESLNLSNVDRFGEKDPSTDKVLLDLTVKEETARVEFVNDAARDRRRRRAETYIFCDSLSPLGRIGQINVGCSSERHQLPRAICRLRRLRASTSDS